MPQINVYNIGKLGVNVDRSPIHLEDGELTKCQNAIRDPLGLDGALHKRPGLARFNSVAAAGSVIGGLGVPISLETAQIEGVTVTAGASGQALYWGKFTKSANLSTSAGWWKSSDKFASSTTVVGAAPTNPRSAQIANFGTASLSILTGAPNSVVSYQNRIFYPSNNYTQNGTAPSVWVFDGVTDQELCRIPTNPLYGEAQSQGILSMIMQGGMIYLSVYDNDGSSSAGTGRVFALDPDSGGLTIFGGAGWTSLQQFPDLHVPYALCWHMNRLWAGTVYRQDTSVAGKIFWCRIGDTGWTLDRTMASGRGCSTLASYQGQLYAGMIGPGTNLIEVRSTLAAWSTSLSTASAAVGTYQAGIVFKGALYVSYWVSVGSITKIFKYTAAAGWTTQYTGSAPTNVPLPMSYVYQGTLFFGGGGDNFNACLVSSPDGTTWTDLTANLAGSNVSGLNAIGSLVP